MNVCDVLHSKGNHVVTLSLSANEILMILCNGQKLLRQRLYDIGRHSTISPEHLSGDLLTCIEQVCVS